MAVQKFTTGSVDYIKDVRRNKANRDWDAFVVINGEECYLGSRDRSWDAEQLCDAYVYDQLARQVQPTPDPEPTISEDTPIATLSNGQTVYGTHDTDGSPLCVSYKTEDGHFFASADGLSGEWAGVPFDITAAQLNALRTLFTGNVLAVLLELAEEWSGERGPELQASIPLKVGMHVFLMVSQALSPIYTNKQISQFTIPIAQKIEDEMGVLDYTYLPALDRVCARREAGMPALPIALHNLSSLTAA